MKVPLDNSNSLCNSHKNINSDIIDGVLILLEAYLFPSLCPVFVFLPQKVAIISIEKKKRGKGIV